MAASDFSRKAAGKNAPVTFRRASDQSLLVELGSEIGEESHQRVVKLAHLLERRPVPGVRNLHPGYCSVLVEFDALALTHQDAEDALKRRLAGLETAPAPKQRNVEIPVCYGGEFGPDLGELSASRGLTESQALELHASADYLVYFLGFVPGFAYLGGLPPKLAAPRLATPRKIVPAGSVGIAGAQTGIYPLATPGGWRLIGRTPLELFRPDRVPMSLLAIGDRVRFKPVSRDEFAKLQAGVRGGT